MNLQKIFSFCLNLFKGMGKESFALIILAVGVALCLKGLINGAQFVDLIKNIGMTYLASHTINSTWGSNNSPTAPALHPDAPVDNPDGP